MTAGTVVRLLQVDDDPEEHLIMEFYLDQVEGLDYELHSVLGTIEAEAAFAAAEYMAVFADELLDSRDPYRTGSAYLDYLVTERPHIIKVLVTGTDLNALCERTREHIRAGRLNFVQKETLSAELLETMIRELLAGAQGPA